MIFYRILLCAAFGVHVVTALAQSSPHETKPSLWPNPNLPRLANPRLGQPTTIVVPNNRLPVPPREWPWLAIGRVNIANGRLSFCTGSLVASRTVVTAAHCLLDARTNGWVKPETVHFVVGDVPGKGYLGHSLAASFVISPDFKCTPEDCPHTQSAGLSRQIIRPQLIKTDWAVITLQDDLAVKPIPIEVIRRADLPSVGDVQVVLPGFGADRPFLLAAHKGCSATTDLPELGLGSLAHGCETFQGGSGSPVLLMRNGAVSIIGIATAAPISPTVPNARGAILGFGVSAAQFAGAAGQ